MADQMNDPSAGGDQAPPTSPAGSQGGGSVSELVAQVGDGLTKLMDVIGKSQAADPEDVQELGQLLQAYQSFVERMSGGGDEKTEDNKPPGNATASLEGGMTGKPMSPAGV